MKRLRELLKYKQLLFHLISIELRMRYHGTVLGILWAMLNPIFMLIIFSFVFGHILKVPIENFPIFFFCGYLPWIFFANSVMSSSFSIIKNYGLINKIYFPREILVLSEVCAHVITFCLQLIVLFIGLFYFEIPLDFRVIIVWLPLLIIIEALFITGISFYFSTLNVFYRDVAQSMEVALMIWFYMTPIFYNTNIVPIEFQYMFTMNPMTHVVESYRNVLLYAKQPAMHSIFVICAVSAAMFVLGYASFIYYEMRFAEEI